VSDDSETLQGLIGLLLSELTLSAEDFHARTSALLGTASVSSQAGAPGSGVSSCGASTVSGRGTRSSRTSPGSSPDSTTCPPVDAEPSDATSSPPTWTPPPWPEDEPPMPGYFARLAAGAWVTSQASLCGRAGWEEFSETWPLSGTMRSGSACQRPPLAPRTSATGFSSSLYGEMVPTPTASLGEATNGIGQDTTTHDTVRKLRETGLLPTREDRRWPTPCAMDGRIMPDMTADEREARGEQVMLSHEVKRMWPTPMAQEGPGGQVMKLTDAMEVEEGRLPKYYRGPETEMLESSGSRSLEPGTCGELNPTWVEWLMGFPREWTDCGASATPWSHRSPSGSAGASPPMPALSRRGAFCGQTDDGAAVEADGADQRGLFAAGADGEAELPEGEDPVPVEPEEPAWDAGPAADGSPDGGLH
jgi:hypothetical protein